MAKQPVYNLLMKFNDQIDFYHKPFGACYLSPIEIFHNNVTFFLIHVLF